MKRGGLYVDFQCSWLVSDSQIKTSPTSVHEFSVDQWQIVPICSVVRYVEFLIWREACFVYKNYVNI